MTYEVIEDTIIFKESSNEIGGLIFNVSNIDNIYSEYNDSVESFNGSGLKRFDYYTPIVNIEDVWINKAYQGQNLFKQAFEMGMNYLKQKYNQFILRACSDNGFPEDKLVSIYEFFGFTPVQKTSNDGTIMILKSEMNECDVAPSNCLTFGDVAGMGDMTFPTDNEPGSGDLPMPSGKVYKQVMPFDAFIKIPKKKKKRKLEKHSDAEHTPNPPMYQYVDDFRTYAERTKIMK